MDRRIVLNYDSYRLVPQYSEIRSRADVDTSFNISFLKRTCPVIPANMMFSEHWMCDSVYEAGAMGSLHRFMTIEKNVAQYKAVKEKYVLPDRFIGDDCFVSVGVNEESRERFQELYNVGARYFIIDIAHGDSVLMREMVDWTNKNYSDCYVMGGNVGTVEAARRLFSWGCDGIKVGLSAGKVCTTKDVTGVSAGSVELLQEIVKMRDDEFTARHIIADGGIRSIGDVVKSIAIGCDLAMSGFLFSKCKESATQGKYFGNASEFAMKQVKDKNSYIPTPEGKEIAVEAQYSAKDLVKQIEGGLRSAMTYSNSRTLEEFKIKAKLVRVDK